MDDVLERADRWLALDPLNGDGSDGYHTTPLIRALAAEVRALRKDRERLDFLLEGLPMAFADDGWKGVIIDREMIDSALSARNEGGAS